jgi:hypothetical protein
MRRSLHQFVQIVKGPYPALDSLSHRRFANCNRFWSQSRRVAARGCRTLLHASSIGEGRRAGDQSDRFLDVPLSASERSRNGEGGIRTPERGRPPLRDFQSRPFNRSGTSPVAGLGYRVFSHARLRFGRSRRRIRSHGALTPSGAQSRSGLKAGRGSERVGAQSGSGLRAGRGSEPVGLRAARRRPAAAARRSRHE